MKLFHYIIFIVTMISVFSCKQQEKRFINQGFIEKLANDKAPFRYDFFFLFVKGDGNNLIVTCLADLHNCYQGKREYKGMSFKNFLSEALNQNLVFQSNQLTNYKKEFILNDSIRKMYKEKGFDSIKATYYNEEKQWMVSGLSESLKYSIMYYFFLNNYVVGIDDVSGSCVMIPQKDIPSLQM